jgi:predicted MFS family arabinose efflux permease
MLAVLARQFDVPTRAVSIIPVLSQTGYAFGILFLSPLGDRFERKGLIVLTMVALAASLAGAALAPSLAWLAAASFVIGVFATVTQQIVPMAVHLAPAAERGKVIGIVTGGVLLGILLSRTVSGTITDHADWRIVYWMAAGLMAVAAAVLSVVLPRVQATTTATYPQILMSLGRLVRVHPLLRRSALIQGLIFASFLAFWSELAVLFEQSPYHLGATAVGLIGIVGAGGALAAPVAGRFADRRGPGAVVALGAAFAVLSFLIFGLLQGSLKALVVGVIIMDLAVQSSLVSNQARVYALDHSARSRLNTIFMTAMFCGGAAGSAIGGLAFQHFGWTGVCLFGGGATLLAALLSISGIKNHSATASQE